jgi:hypothetical protein
LCWQGERGDGELYAHDTPMTKVKYIQHKQLTEIFHVDSAERNAVFGYGLQKRADNTAL